MPALSVNLNKVALLRNSRPLGIPDVVHCGQLALQAGASGLTVHPRPDARHIRPDDVTALAELLRQWPAAEYNIEGNPLHQLMTFVESERPDQCTFVPDDDHQLTSDHGWDLKRYADELAPLIHRAHELGVRVSLFMDADASAMRVARQIGADRVELYTEPYARAFGTPDELPTLTRYRLAADAARSVGLGVNAGHDLNLQNLGPFLTSVPNIDEVSIGHALIADALQFGLFETVGRYVAVVRVLPSAQGVQST